MTDPIAFHSGQSSNFKRLCKIQPHPYCRNNSIRRGFDRGAATSCFFYRHDFASSRLNRNMRVPSAGTSLSSRSIEADDSDIYFRYSVANRHAAMVETRAINMVNAPFPDDTARALSETQRDTREPVTVISSWNGLPSTNAEAVWSAFHGPANIVLFPSAMRRRFLTQTAGALERSGWLIIPHSELRGTLIADFDIVYSRTEVRDSGSVLAIRYAPTQ